MSQRKGNITDEQRCKNPQENITDEQGNIIDEQRCKNPQQNTGKQNPTAH